MPRLGAPTLGGQAHLTIAETESSVGAPTKPAPGAQFRGLAILQAAEKKWSALADDFRTLLQMTCLPDMQLLDGRIGILSI